MKIAAAYIRVSTDDQIEYSPESQRKAVIDYAKRNDMLVPEKFIFSDEGISGRSTKRPAFQRMIGIAKTKPKPFDVILVWKFSRFARNREDSIVYKSMLRKQCGIEVISISEQLGEDKTSILIEALLEAMDEYYSINLAEEVVRGMSEKARRGGTMGKPAYGYRSEHGNIVVDHEAADVVRRIFSEFDEGKPVKAIAAELNRAGERTRSGKLWENRSIEYILRNIFYIGSAHWTPGAVRDKRQTEIITENTIITEHTHEPLVPEVLFRRCQERLDQNKRFHIENEHPTHGRMFPLKGLTRCSSCGATLTYSNNGVQCHRFGRGQCQQSHYITLPKLDKLVMKTLQADFACNRFSTVIQYEKKHSQTENVSLQKELDKVNEQLKRVKEAYAAGVDTLEEYKENKIRMQLQISRLREQMKPANQHYTVDFPEKLHSAFKSGIAICQSDAPDELKNALLKAFIHHVTFDRKEERVELFYYF